MLTHRSLSSIRLRLRTLSTPTLSHLSDAPFVRVTLGMPVGQDLARSNPRHQNTLVCQSEGHLHFLLHPAECGTTMIRLGLLPQNQCRQHLLRQCCRVRLIVVRMLWHRAHVSDCFLFVHMHVVTQRCQFHANQILA